MCEIQAKVQNLEITYKVEINHLNNKLELLSKKVHMLETKLKSDMKCPENSISGSVKEVKVTANEEKTESKQNTSSESKDTVYKCDQCQLKFKRKKNLQKHIHNKHLKNAIKCTKFKNSFDSEKELKNHMSKKHNKHKSVNNDDSDSLSVKDNKTEQSSSKDDNHEVYSEESNSDSESDILEPYICPECGKECDDLEDFSDHFKQAHNL